MSEISRNIFGLPDPEEDLHGPPLEHPHLPAHLPQTDPLTIMHRAAGIADPRLRAAELTARLAIAQQWVTWGSEQRDRAVLQMREDGASYDELAATLRISKSRAQQLCRRLNAKYPEGLEQWQRMHHDSGGGELTP